MTTPPGVTGSQGSELTTGKFRALVWELVVLRFGGYPGIGEGDDLTIFWLSFDNDGLGAEP